jgi:hypothetical protein
VRYITGVGLVWIGLRKCRSLLNSQRTAKPLLSIFLSPTFKIQRPTSVRGAVSAKRPAVGCDPNCFRVFGFVPTNILFLKSLSKSYSSPELIYSSLRQMKIDTEKTPSQVTAEALKDEGNVLFSHGKKYQPNNSID